MTEDKKQQTWKCEECKKEQEPQKVPLSVFQKKMCSPTCCQVYRDREDSKKPKLSTRSFYKPDAFCQI